MTDIERIEAEIAQKKSELKQLKEALNPRLNYRSILDPLNERYKYFGGLDYLTDPLRKLTTTIATMHWSENSYGKYISTAGRIVKVGELNADTIRICNEFIEEIAPIVTKYIDKFVQINEAEE